jgi:hypothetical protein
MPISIKNLETERLARELAKEIIARPSASASRAAACPDIA